MDVSAENFCNGFCLLLFAIDMLRWLNSFMVVNKICSSYCNLKNIKMLELHSENTFG